MTGLLPRPAGEVGKRTTGLFPRRHPARSASPARLTPLVGGALVLVALARTTSAQALPGPEILPAALATVPGADLVFFDEPHAGQQTSVLTVARVRGPAAKVRAVLLDPAAYKRAVPSFRKAEVVARQGTDVQVAWELEVPLWNLGGKLWLRPVPEGVDIALVEGDLSPGLFQVRVQPAGDGLLLSVAGHANMRDANWATRRLVKRSPLAEPAMTATAAWVLLRALVLEVEGPAGGLDPRRRPAPRWARRRSHPWMRRRWGGWRASGSPRGRRWRRCGRAPMAGWTGSRWPPARGSRRRRCAGR
jgi:hypothetical protein